MAETASAPIDKMDFNNMIESDNESMVDERGRWMRTGDDERVKEKEEKNGDEVVGSQVEEGGLATLKGLRHALLLLFCGWVVSRYYFQQRLSHIWTLVSYRQMKTPCSRGDKNKGECVNEHNVVTGEIYTSCKVLISSKCLLRCLWGRMVV